MLKLRRGTVVEAAPLVVEVDRERRPAWADEGLIGPVEPGDLVIVNTEALDLGLGSGGFDIVCANLTRGLGSAGAGGEHVIKLNYSPLQHPVEPVERPIGDEAPAAEVPVLVIPLHGHLAPAAWAAARVRPGLRLGYVQTAGGALPGALSDDVAALRGSGLLDGHVTAGPAYGGEREAIGTAGALDAAGALGWQAVIAGPGPGMLGSETRLGHGGMAALDTAHAALSLRMPTVISPRLSESDPRPRHRGLSHHTETVLSMLLAPAEVALPERSAELAGRIEATGNPVSVIGLDRDEVAAYRESGLPTATMGRGIDRDRLFFEAALASGRRLAELS